MTVELRSLVVHDVPVSQVPSDDELCVARLIFGVGTRDEELHEQGVLHALEHVVMSQLRLTPLDINAHVGTSHTEFSVAGDPLLVGDFLAQLSRSLVDPPVNRLSAEAPVIAAELGQEEGAHQPLLARRYGIRDLGSHAVPGPGPDGLRSDQLRAAAERWFTAGNALLLVDGPLPPDLSLPLASGPRPTHVRVAPRKVDGPSGVLVDGPACMASMLLPPTDPAYLSEVTVELVEHCVMEAVRHRDGLSYVVETNVLDNVPHPAGPGGHDLFVLAEPPENHLVEAVTVLVEALRGLLQAGPSEGELSLAVERVVGRRRGRLGMLEQAHTTGVDDLLGFSRPRFDPARTRAITMDQVRSYLQPLEHSLVVALPDHPEIDLRALGLRADTVAPTTRGDLPVGRRFRAPLLARALSSAARQAELCLAAGGLHARLEGEIQSIAWAEVVGILVEGEDEAAVFGADGSHIQIGKAVWRDGNALIDAVRENVAPHVFYDASVLLKARDDEF